MTRGLVFNIQRYSIHDGTGIRTIVFLKGCPLKCPWCSNPESQGPVRPSVWMKDGAEEPLGKWMSVDEVLHEVEKDEIFYRTSNGGVTLSGGEVLMQADFAAELLKEVKALGISTAIETTGAFPLKQIRKVLPYTDQVLFDLKIMDPDKARQIIGEKISTIKQNFEEALNSPAHVIPRIPLIPGYTTPPENLRQIRDYVTGLGIKEIHILPFHQYGSGKYEYLKRSYRLKDTPLLKQEEINTIKAFFESAQIKTVVSGLE
ncbi:MAG: glycyl-radical enzyme activating protein [Sporolactobacillus sp.]